MSYSQIYVNEGDGNPFLNICCVTDGVQATMALVEVTPQQCREWADQLERFAAPKPCPVLEISASDVQELAS